MKKTAFKKSKIFGDRPIILGYNIDFDYAMLSSLFQRNNRQLQVSAILDVMEMGYDVCFETNSRIISFQP